MAVTARELSAMAIPSTARIATIRRMASTLVNRPLDDNTEDFLEQAAASKFDFHRVSVKAAGDERLKKAVNNAVLRQHSARQLRILELPDGDQLRQLAGD